MRLKVFPWSVSFSGKWEPITTELKDRPLISWLTVRRKRSEILDRKGIEYAERTFITSERIHPRRQAPA